VFWVALSVCFELAVGNRVSGCLGALVLGRCVQDRIELHCSRTLGEDSSNSEDSRCLKDEHIVHLPDGQMIDDGCRGSLGISDEDIAPNTMPHSPFPRSQSE
jgi:hypothetical protein